MSKVPPTDSAGAGAVPKEAPGRLNLKTATQTTPLPDNAADSPENETEVRAQFTTPSLIDGAAPRKETKPQTSPLLSSTPPTVAKALIKAYPYLLIVNKTLSIFTWTNDDYWVNIVLMCVWGFGTLYFETVVTWFGHIVIVGIITLYALLNYRIEEETKLHPTLDDVVQALTTTCIKADLLLAPITSLSLNAYDIKRLLFTTVFLTPLYLIITFLVITPRTVLLMAGLYVLTYNSTYLRVTRKLLWKIKLARLLVFYLTGLDFSRARNHSLFAAAFAKVQKNTLFNSEGNLDESGDGHKSVRFTYAIYENQRRWLGIGWTSNLLSYERTPWTDEFLNELSSIDTFQLPNPENNNYSFGSQQSNQLTLNGAKWRWVDKTWRLDLTNDGSITLPNSKRSKTTANPGPDEGFIFYDNTWKKPTTEDTFSKYTRRRRWIRTAELVLSEKPSEEVLATGSEKDAVETDSKVKKRKSLRFAEDGDEKGSEDPVRTELGSSPREKVAAKVLDAAEDLLTSSEAGGATLPEGDVAAKE